MFGKRCKKKTVPDTFSKSRPNDWRDGYNIRRYVGKQHHEPEYLRLHLSGHAAVAGAELTSGSSSQGQVVQNNFLGTQPGEILAMDIPGQSGDQPPPTVWLYSDLSGTVASLGVLSGTGTWQIQRVGLAARDCCKRVGRHNDGLFSSTGDLEWGAAGSYQYSCSANLHDQRNTYDPAVNRFLSVGNISPNSPNPYTLNGNNPINANGGVNWSNISGPNAFNGVGALGYGVWDSITFGHLDSVIGMQGAQAEAQQNPYYWLGMGAGVAGQILLGNLAAGISLLNASRTAYVGARAYQAYTYLGDAVGAYDSFQAVRSGNFSALDLLGFAPTIGWATRGYNRPKGTWQRPRTATTWWRHLERCTLCSSAWDDPQPVCLQ